MNIRSTDMSENKNKSTSYIGQSIARKEDDRLLQGGGLFVDDVKFPGQLEMAVVRCPFPHAKILSIETSAAENFPGVVQILTGEDIELLSDPITVLRPVPGAPQLPYYALARSRALHEGQAVASVVATSRAIAEDAMELINVDYEPLEHVVSTLASMNQNAPVLHPDQLSSNVLASNTDKAGKAAEKLAGSDVEVRDRFIINRVAPLPMETRGIVVSWRAAAKELMVRSSTQAPHLMRKQLAESLRIDESSIRVVASDVGGAYGQKLGVFPEDVLAAIHAMQLGRPVKWIEDRMEHFRASTHGRESIHDMVIASNKKGKITAILNEYSTDIGGWNSPFGSSQLSSVVFTGPYKVRDAEIKRNVVLTNKTPVGAYRGYGQPEVNFALEVLLDRLARKLGKSPLELRRENMLLPKDLPWKTPSGAIYDNGDYIAPLEMVAKAVDYDAHFSKARLPREDGRILGIGLSSFVERTGYASARFLASRGSKFGAHESVTLRANRSGGVDLYTGVSTFGQGNETAFAQICADLLGMDYDVIRVHAGDTASSPLNTGAFASRTLIAVAGALQKATRKFLEKSFAIAAIALDVRPEELIVRDKVIHVIDNSDKLISFKEVFNRAITGQGIPENMEPGLDVTVHFEPRDASFAFGTAAAVVAVDPTTGEFEIERFVLAHDCGVPVNPMVVEGQVRGALVQGLGAALAEELRYDKDTGQLVNGSMMDYFAPMAAHLPPMEFLHTQIPSDVTTFGVRGVGEIGTIPPAAAITNALCDALVDYNVDISELPVTPERVWLALNKK